jgi:hypothetical protein
MGHKNDYSVTVFLSSGEVKKWGFVHRLDGFVNFLNNKHSTWSYMNVYDRRKREYLKRFYKGNLVPDFI